MADGTRQTEADRKRIAEIRAGSKRRVRKREPKKRKTIDLSANKRKAEAREKAGGQEERKVIDLSKEKKRAEAGGQEGRDVAPVTEERAWNELGKGGSFSLAGAIDRGIDSVADYVNNLLPEGDFKNLMMTEVAVSPGQAAVGAFLLGGLTYGSGSYTTDVSGIKVTPKDIAARGARAGAWKTNAKTVDLTRGILSKAGMPIAVAGFVATIAGNWVFAKFELAEATDKIGIAMFKASDAGREDLVLELAQYQEDMLDLNVWETVMGAISFLNVRNTIKKNIDAAAKAAAVYRELAEDEAIAKANGEDEEAKWARIREKEKQNETDMIDYYNSERKKLLEWEREAELANRNADATFWAAEREKQSAKEAEDAEALANFWLEYRKKAQLIADNNRPSNLNFGLL